MKNQYQAILLDVDGTLLDFNQAEADGMKVVLKTYGFEPTQERLSLYHEINERAWAAFERGEVTKERLVCQRFVDFFGALGKEVDGEAAEKLYRSQPPFSLREPWRSAVIFRRNTTSTSSPTALPPPSTSVWPLPAWTGL